MNLTDARKLAEHLADLMRPHCERLEIAGSIRRGKLEPKDLELVCIPRWDTVNVMVGLFEEERQVNALHQWAANPNCPVKWIKSGTPEVIDWHVKPDGKYWRGLYQGMKLDLFLVTPDNWGIQFVIRTGCADYSQAIVTRAREHGYPCAGGYLHELTDEGPIIPTPEEADVFTLLGLWQPPPRERDSAAKVMPLRTGPGSDLDTRALLPEPLPEAEAEPDVAEPEDYPHIGEVWRSGSGSLCAGCWKRFPVDDLVVVNEQTGKGFRCQSCVKGE